MLGSLRILANTWPARILFFVLAAAFVGWGVATRTPFGGSSDTIATVGGAPIAAPQVQQAYQQELGQVSRQMGNPAEIPQALRRQVAMQALDQAVMRQALRNKERQLGLAVPDAALRDAALAIPQFHGPNGQFDHALMLSVLQQNNLTEQRFLDDLAQQLRDRQLLGAVTSGAVAPDILLRQVFTFQHELRTADAVLVRLDAAAAPPPPSDAQVQRWYENHPQAYSAPEYRRIRAVILTPEVVGRDVAVSDEELRAAYAQQKSQFVTPERRSVQVITAPDEATAQKLSTQWSLGADWDTMQKAAQADQATAVALDAAAKTEFPAPELADAAFTANPDTVSPPVKGALGWYVVRVTQVEPGGTQSFEQAREAIRQHLVADKAADLIDQYSSKVDDLLAGGTALKDLPPDLGLAAVTGTLDAQGNTPAGRPAPIPGSAALRKALVAAAFAAKPGDALKLQRVAEGEAAYFAVDVESIEKPAPRPLDQVRDAVSADWTRDQRQREADATATRIYSAVGAGMQLEAAARQAGLAVQALPPVGRLNPTEGVPDKLVAPLFALRPGQATMVQTPDGFMVAVLRTIDDPAPSADPVGYAQLRERLAAAMGQDIESTYAFALRLSQKPTVNDRLLSQMTADSE
jgi:peptidyl-prolyl cis-trans isomerase D